MTHSCRTNLKYRHVQKYPQPKVYLLPPRAPSSRLCDLCAACTVELLSVMRGDGFDKSCSLHRFTHPQSTRSVGTTQPAPDTSRVAKDQIAATATTVVVFPILEAECDVD